MRIEVKFMGQISCEIHETKAEKLRGQIQFHKPNLGMRERERYIYIYHWVSYSWGLSYTNIRDIMEIHNLKLEFPLPSSQFLGLLAFQGMASMQINRDKPKHDFLLFGWLAGFEFFTSTLINSLT